MQQVNEAEGRGTAVPRPLPHVRRRRLGVALLVSALLAAGCAGADEDPRDIDAALGRYPDMVGDNGLFTGFGQDRSAVTESLETSAYGVSVLRLAGRDLPAPRDAAAARAARRAEVDREPVWGRWYALRTDGRPGPWAVGALAAVPAAGSAEETVALTAAAAEVAADRPESARGPDRDRLVERLDGAVGELTNAYSWCRARDAAKLLGHDTARWRTPAFPRPKLGEELDTRTLMDVYGTLCLRGHHGAPTADAQIRAWLEPQLAADIAGREFEAYFAAHSWLLAGGDRAALGTWADALRGRIDTGTGLVAAPVAQLGMLHHTYYAAMIADSQERAREAIPEETVRAVRTATAALDPAVGPVDLLMAAVVLQVAGEPDDEVRRRAEAGARRRLAKGVGRDEAEPAARTVLLLEQLGADVPKFPGRSFPVGSDEDRYLAWRMLSLAEYMANGPEVARAFAPQTRTASAALRDPGALQVKEAVAATEVADDFDMNKPTDRFLDWVGALKGCPGDPAFYRPHVKSPSCTWEATQQLLARGFAYQDLEELRKAE